MNNTRKSGSPSRWLSLAVCGSLVLSSTGCSLKAGTLSPSAQFVYPNSNIEPIGAVTVSKKKTKFMTAPSLSMDELEGLYREALSQKDGNILVNVKVDTKSSFVVIPVIVVPITVVWTTWTISGVAAKMTVGKQELGAMIESDLQRLNEQLASAPPPEPEQH